MQVISSGVQITVCNAVRRLRAIFVWFVMRAGRLLLKLPLASIELLAHVGSFLLSGKNKRVVAAMLTTAALLVASRTLINQANRKRL